MWRQGRLCYLQLSLQQGYHNQWPVMTGTVANAGKYNPRSSHCNHYNTKIQQYKGNLSSKWKNYRFSRNGGLWKKKKSYWRGTRSQNKKQMKHCPIEAHQRKPRFCKFCQKRHHKIGRKRFIRQQRLLAFMRTAIKGRLRPMNLCEWRAPGMRAPRNTTQFIMHQVYQDMHQEKKAAAAAAAAAATIKREKEKTDLQLSLGENYSHMGSTSASCMAALLAISPESNLFSGYEEAGENGNSQNSYACGNSALESHVSISCEP